MVYYVRKIARSKWQAGALSSDTQLAEKEIKGVSSDAITNCIKTTENKLSLWRVEQKSDTIDDIIPLIVGFEKPATCDVIYISEDDLEKEGLNIKQSKEDANVPIERLKEYHYNAYVNDYEGLGKFAKVVLKSLDSHKRFKGKEVKEKLQSMLKNHEIEENMISQKLYDKIS